jgi:signal transduction histidine kinase
MSSPLILIGNLSKNHLILYWFLYEFGLSNQMIVQYYFFGFFKEYSSYHLIEMVILFCYFYWFGISSETIKKTIQSTIRTARIMKEKSKESKRISKELAEIKEKVQESHQRNIVLQEIIKFIQHQENFDGMILGLKNRLKEAFGIENFMVFVYDQANQRIQIKETIVNSDEITKEEAKKIQNQLNNLSIPLSDKKSIIVRSFQKHRVIHLKKLFFNDQSLSQFDQLIQDSWKQKSLLCIPMVANNYCFGIFATGDSVYSSNISKLGKDEINDLVQVIQFISSVIYQSIQKESAKKALERIEKVQNLISIIQTSESLNGIMQLLTQKLNEYYQIDNFLIYILSPDKQKLPIEYVSSIQGALGNDLELVSTIQKLKNMWLDVDDQKSLIVASFRNRRSIFVKEINKRSPSRSESAIQDLCKQSSLFTIPMIMNGEVFGMLAFGDNKFSSGIAALTKESREDIVQVVSFLSSSIYHSKQKEVIQKSLQDLRESQDALSKAERESSVNQLAAHLAHEVNNPLNFISTSLSSLKFVSDETESKLFSIIPETDESKNFRIYLSSQFSSIKESLEQANFGKKRIEDTILEIRGITGVDGLRIENFDLLQLLRDSLDLVVQKNQLTNSNLRIEINEEDYFGFKNNYENIMILSNKHIISRSIKTVLSSGIYFSQKSINPRIKIIWDTNPIDEKVRISIFNNGPKILDERIESVFDLKKTDHNSTELIGIPMVKELLKTINCDLNCIDSGKISGWVGFQLELSNH